MTTTLIVTMTFLAVMGLIWGAADWALARRRQLAQRVWRYGTGAWGAPEAPTDQPLPEGPLRVARLSPVVRFVRRVQILRPLVLRVEQELIQAHIMLRPEEFVAITLLAGIAAAAILRLLFPDSAAVVVGGACGLVIPIAALVRAKNRRQRKIEQQIPDLLAVLINALRAGHSLVQALSSVCEEIPDPLGQEFSQALNEIRLGVSIDLALNRLIPRVGVEDLDLVVTAALIQRQVGGNLAEILERISHTCKERIRIRFMLRTATAQGRMSAWIISLLPVAFTAMLSVVDPAMFRVLTGNTLGHVLLLLAVVMELTGILVIRSIVNIPI